jgi:hypothetical protein
MAMSESGDLFIATNFVNLNRLLVVTRAGGIRTLAGGANRCVFGTQITVCDPVQPMVRGLATQFRFANVDRIALFPDGRIFIADGADQRRRIISNALPGFDENDLAVASEDGGVVYQFNEFGRHLRTLDAMMNRPGFAGDSAS